MSIEITILNFSLIDLHIYHPALQPLQDNPCQNHKCSHLCLISSNTTKTCSCPQDMQLRADNQTCEHLLKQKRLVVGVGNYILSVRHRTFGRHESDGGAKIIHMHIDHMALNTLTGEMFIADNKAHTISLVNTSSLLSKELVFKNIGNVSAMGFGK